MTAASHLMAAALFSCPGSFIQEHHEAFYFSFVFTAVALALWAWGFHLNGVSGALAAVTLAALLAAMEVSLSFDNAVVNAGVLKTMNHFWRMMFP